MYKLPPPLPKPHQPQPKIQTHQHKCIGNPNHKHSKPKLGILRSETQITKLDIEMNQYWQKGWKREKTPERETTKARSGLSLNWSHSGLWWLLMMVTIWQKGWEREIMLERETDLAKGGKREKKNKGSIWWSLVMVMIGVVVVACGGAMKGQWEERALGKRKKKWRRRRDREKNGLEWECQTDFWRETLCEGTSHTGGYHSLLNFTKMPLKLNSQKLKTPKSYFHFPSSTSKILSIWVMRTMIQNYTK